MRDPKIEKLEAEFNKNFSQELQGHHICIVEKGAQLITAAEIERRRQWKKLMDSRGRDIRGNYVMIKEEAFYQITRLTVEEKGYLFRLLLLSSFMKENDNGVPLKVGRKNVTVEMLVKIWGISKYTVREKIKRLKELNIIVTKEDNKDKRIKWILLNDEYFAMGKTKSQRFIKLYFKKGRELFKQLAEKGDNRFVNKLLGTMVGLLCKMHYDTQLIVRNPEKVLYEEKISYEEIFNEQYKKLKPIQQKDLLECTKVDDFRTLDTYLQDLIKLRIIKDTGLMKNCYIVHPDLAFRQDSGILHPLYQYVINKYFADELNDECPPPQQNEK